MTYESTEEQAYDEMLANSRVAVHLTWDANTGKWSIHPDASVLVISDGGVAVSSIPQLAYQNDTPSTIARLALSDLNTIINAANRRPF